MKLKHLLVATLLFFAALPACGQLYDPSLIRPRVVPAVPPVQLVCLNDRQLAFLFPDTYRPPGLPPVCAPKDVVDRIWDERVEAKLMRWTA